MTQTYSYRFILIQKLPLMFFMVLGTTVSACEAPKNQQCKEVCKIETRCAAKKNAVIENFPYDLDECIAACVSLEKDKDGKVLVEAHLRCAKEAEDDCDKLMKCQ